MLGEDKWNVNATGNLTPPPRRSLNKPASSRAPPFPRLLRRVTPHVVAVLDNARDAQNAQRANRGELATGDVALLRLLGQVVPVHSGAWGVDKLLFLEEGDLSTRFLFLFFCGTPLPWTTPDGREAAEREGSWTRRKSDFTSASASFIRPSWLRRSLLLRTCEESRAVRDKQVPLGLFGLGVREPRGEVQAAYPAQRQAEPARARLVKGRGRVLFSGRGEVRLVHLLGLQHGSDAGGTGEGGAGKQKVVGFGEGEVVEQVLHGGWLVRERGESGCVLHQDFRQARVVVSTRSSQQRRSWNFRGDVEAFGKIVLENISSKTFGDFGDCRLNRRFKPG